MDVILTNQTLLCFGALNFGCGISDWHNMIGVAVRGATVRDQKQKTKYRSFKNFDQKKFNEDVGRVPFHVAGVFDDVDDILYWAHERLLTDIIDEHAPIKERAVKSRRPAYMNGDLHGAVYKKRMLFNRYKKCRTSANWEDYRKQRNHVTKLKKQSMRLYFFERCSGAPKSKDFWPTIKPFLSKTAVGGGNEVILCEEDKVVSDQPEVCNIFNKYFVNVAKDIGKEADQYRDDFSDHPSIEIFLENMQQSTSEETMISHPSILMTWSI